MSSAAWPQWSVPRAEDLKSAADFDALAARFPNSSSAQRRLLGAAHPIGDAARVRAGLARLAALGYAPSAATMQALAPHVPAEEMAALSLRVDANRSVVQSSRLFATVPASARLVEGIAWDPRRRRLFATSVVGRELVYGDGRTWRAVPGFSPGSLFGIAVDDARRLLWVASGSLEQTPSPATAFRGLIALNLDNFREVHRIALPGGGSPADLTLASDGTVYAADPIGGSIWRLGVGDAAATVLVPPGVLRSPQGMVQSSDRRRLYVSDYSYGLAIVDTNDGSVTPLATDVPTMLDGIDGLLPWRGGLLAIQNGTNPRRIIHFTLSADGRRIAGARVVESGHPEWGEPTLGVLRGDNLIYVADAQWDRYGPGGAVTGEGPTRPTPIRIARLPR
jgi:hypothetical protein